MHEHVGIVVLANVYNQADEIEEPVKCVLPRKIGRIAKQITYFESP